MRTTVLFLASAIALCLVLPFCSARPGELYVKKEQASQASEASASEQESSESVVKQGCGGAYVASKKSSQKAAASSSASSSSSYVLKKSDGGCTLLTEAQIKEKYARKSSESLEEYFKRIVAKSYSWTSTTEAYIKTLSLVWKDFYDLDLWYDRKYIDLVKEFYSVYYAKQESETLEAYYSRIIKKEAWESEELFAKRITVIRDCFPTLDLWLSEKWFNKYTRALYALEFKKFEKETEAEWAKRIFERDLFFDTSDEIWAKRLFFIQEATISNCNLWYSKEYFSYFKKFYQIYYKKQEKESCDGWLLRALTPLPGESLDNAIKRVSFIKEVTGDCGCWKEDYFKKIQAEKKLQEAWLLKVQKAFFPCGCGSGAVVVKRASTNSASSSKASSESSKYSKVVSA